MSSSRVRLQLALWALVVLGSVGLVAGRSVSGSPRVPSLAVHGVVPEFSLHDQAGQPFTQAQLDGKIWIVDFIFTSCAGQCLLMSDQMRALQRAFGQTPELGFLSFSVDPERDTSTVLSAYAARHGADPRWHLVTGDRQQLHTLSREGFHLAVAERSTNAKEPIVHSVRLVLIDRQQRIRGYYEATNPQAIARLRADVARLLKEGS
jgi:protein SCO1/2